MTSHEWESVKDAVFACEPLDPPARARWLDANCPAAVRSEVERLLESAPPPSFLDVPAAEQLLDLAKTLPDRIGRFRILHELGAGGMGVVYAAVDEKLGRRVALKVLPQPVVADEEQRRRLLWDARAASALNHPNIVCVYDVGDDAGIDYVAMELLAGRTLADVLATERLSPERLLRCAAQIAAALDAAHAHGIVHRDLKPGNVVITDDGVVKLVDFGLAKNAQPAPADQSAPQTLEGRLAGTAAYMSPEQAEGADVDARSDIFSFGSVLYEMQTGRRAFSGGSMVSVLAKIIHAEPTPVAQLDPSCDPRLDEIIRRCLEKDRGRRFQSMAEVRVRLQEILDGHAPRAKQRRLSRSARWALVSVAVAGTVAAAAAYVVFGRQSSPAPFTLARVTWDGGLTTAPAISADGSILAYASDRAGHGDLDVWVQQIGGGGSLRVTTDPADESQPVFAPDGTHVAFRSERDGGGVYVVPSLGGTERLLVPGCHDPNYSPDGRWVACWIGDVGGGFYAGTSHIVIVPASGGPVRAFRPDFESAAYPLWTRDGKALVFLGRKREPGSDRSTVDWWMAPDGPAGERALGATRLFKDGGLTAPQRFYWIRPETWLDDHTILFTAEHADATDVWGVNLDSDVRLSGPAQPLTFGAAVQAFPKSAAASRNVGFAFASLTYDVELRSLPIASQAGKPQEPKILLPGTAQIGSPSITADGRLLVFSSKQADGYRIIAVDTVAGGEQRTVATIGSTQFIRAVVSGDGAFVVYTTKDGVGYRVATRLGTPEPICARCGWATHVNRDGSQALFESAGSDEQLVLWSGGKTRPLIAGAASDQPMQFGGRFSPDGRWVAFCAGARQGTERQIVVVPNAPERTLRPDEFVRVTDGTTADREPYWAPDGTRLYFLSDRDGYRCIWACPMDPRTGRPTGAAYEVAHFHHARELLQAPGASAGAIGLSASRDALVFTVLHSSGNIWQQTRSGR